MARWISDGSIVCKEVSPSHGETHNNISGNPLFRARLKVLWNEAQLAKSKLCGEPEDWPHQTIFQNVKCVSCEITPDGGAYTVDSDGEILAYQYAFLDVTYAPRPGVYLEDYNNQDVYWYDELDPRVETKPMNHQVLIWGGDDPAQVPQNKIPLHPDEAPTRYFTGQTLRHTIEGWCIETDDLADYIGTVNADEYYSPVLLRTFPAETLLLRSLAITREISFRSYRQPTSGPPPVPPSFDPSGLFTNKLLMTYEYKKEGWNRFYRNDPDTNTSGYYYIRYDTSPYDTIEPAPVVNHDKWLSS